MRSGRSRKVEGSGWEWGAECALVGGFGDGVGGVVGEGFEDGACAFGFFREEDGDGVFEGGEAVVLGAGVALDAVEECGEVEEFRSGVDELEVKDFLLARHGGTVTAEEGLVNREGW